METNFGVYLRDHNINLSDLAKHVETTVESLRNYASGESIPRWGIARKIGKYLGVDLETFLDLFEMHY